MVMDQPHLDIEAPSVQELVFSVHRSIYTPYDSRNIESFHYQLSRHGVRQNLVEDLKNALCLQARQ